MICINSELDIVHDYLVGIRNVSYPIHELSPTPITFRMNSHPTRTTNSFPVNWRAHDW